MRLATVVSQAPGDSMASCCCGGHGVPAGVGLLDDVLGLGQGAEQPVGEVDQLTPLAHDRAQARIGPPVSWPGLGGHGVSLPLVASALTSSTTAAPNCEVGASPDIPSCCVVVPVRAERQARKETTMEPRLDIMTNDVAAKVVKYLVSANKAAVRLDPAGGDPGAGEDPGQPDQRLRLLPRHAHQGRRARRRDLGAAQPGRGVAGGHGLHRGRARRAGADRAGHPHRRRAGGVTDEAWANAAKHYDEDQLAALVAQSPSSTPSTA